MLLQTITKVFFQTRKLQVGIPEPALQAKLWTSNGMKDHKNKAGRLKLILKAKLSKFLKIKNKI